MYIYFEVYNKTKWARFDNQYLQKFEQASYIHSLSNIGEVLYSFQGKSSKC